MDKQITITLNRSLLPISLIFTTLYSCYYFLVFDSLIVCNYMEVWSKYLLKIFKTNYSKMSLQNYVICCQNFRKVTESTH